MTDDDRTELIREILTELQALREERALQASELAQRKAGMFRIEQRQQSVR